MVEEKKKGSNFGGSRPPKYQPVFDRIAHDYILKTEKASDRGLAKLLGVTANTIIRWKLEHESFRDAYNEAKDHVNIHGIENSLIKIANGFEYEEVTQEVNPLTGELQIKKIVKKLYPPDKGAIETYLRNRAPKRWPKGEAHEGGSLTINITRDDDNADTARNQLQASPDTLAIHEG